MSYVPIQQAWLCGMGASALAIAPTLGTGTIDATGEKYAFIGRVWNKDRATKNITKVGFSFGVVTKAGGSALTVSLQNVDLTNGPVIQPDEVQDQTVAIANANAAFASNTWMQTAALSAVRSVAFGELLAVVIEFDGAGRLGADSVIIRAAALATASHNDLQSGCYLKTGGTWALISQSQPAVILEFDDGTFGTLDGGFPMSAVTNLAFHSGSVADEVALEFTVPFNCKCDGAYFGVAVASGADFEVVLYEGTTPLATVSVDANAIHTAATARAIRVSFPEVELLTGNTYRLAIKPTTANSVTIYQLDVNAANHFQAWPGESGWGYTTRVDGGSWAAKTTTRRPVAGLRLSAVDTGGAVRKRFIEA